jgi:hypothetical protein
VSMSEAVAVWAQVAVAVLTLFVLIVYYLQLRTMQKAAQAQSTFALVVSCKP